MIATRCQVCGRAKALRIDGMIVHHHFNGNRCYGAGAAPDGRGDISALLEAQTHWDGMAAGCEERRADHARRSLNEPLGASFWEFYARAARERARLSGRIYRRTYAVARAA